MRIQSIFAREILDSRGNPTIETKIILDNGMVAKASVPSGASTGVHEAYELRDQDIKRYNGLGVLKAVKNVEEIIAPKLKGVNIEDQEKIDQIMIDLDGTENKKNLGANAILSVSLAATRAAALASNQELYLYLHSTFNFSLLTFNLPVPCFNIFNGGKHADTNLDFQEFMIIPLTGGNPLTPNPSPILGSRESGTLASQVQMGSEIFHELGRVLKKVGLDTDVGNEGGYAPNIHSSIQAIEFILAAAKNVGYEPGKDVGLGIDVGSSGLYNPKTKKYIFKLDNAVFANTTLVGLYHEWLKKYPIVLLEDGLAEDDWEGWRELTKELGSEMMLVGDDLFVTNINRLRQGIKENVANTVLIKPNQIGTLTETIACVKLAQKHNYKIMISHRSGETNDDFIADLAVAVGADYIKAGSLCRGERLAKYNRLMEIEKNIVIPAEAGISGRTK
jgi:enolase